MKDWSVSAVLLGIGGTLGSFAALVGVLHVVAAAYRPLGEVATAFRLSSGDGDACMQVFDATPSSKNGLYCRPRPLAPAAPGWRVDPHGNLQALSEPTNPSRCPVSVHFGHIGDGPPLVSADGEWVLDQVGGELIDLKAGGITQ